MALLLMIAKIVLMAVTSDFALPPPTVNVAIDGRGLAIASATVFYGPPHHPANYQTFVSTPLRRADIAEDVVCRMALTTIQTHYMHSEAVSLYFRHNVFLETAAAWNAVTQQLAMQHDQTLHENTRLHSRLYDISVELQLSNRTHQLIQEAQYAQYQAHFTAMHDNYARLMADVTWLQTQNRYLEMHAAFHYGTGSGNTPTSVITSESTGSYYSSESN